MINPLINKLPTDTLHQIYCILDFIDSLPNEDGDGAFMSQKQLFGYFSILQCVKNALKFELERTRTVPALADDELPHPAKLIGGIENIKHPALKNRLLAELWQAIDLCTKPETTS